jgi:hypothetical protein
MTQDDHPSFPGLRYYTTTLSPCPYRVTDTNRMMLVIPMLMIPFMLTRLHCKIHRSAPTRRHLPTTNFQGKPANPLSAGRSSCSDIPETVRPGSWSGRSHTHPAMSHSREKLREKRTNRQRKLRALYIPNSDSWYRCTGYYTTVVAHQSSLLCYTHMHLDSTQPDTHDTGSPLHNKSLSLTPD